MEATLSSKNQATIPKQVRDYLHLKAGDRFKFFLQPDGAVVLLPVVPTRTLKGSLAGPGRTVTMDEMNDAIKAGGTARAKRR